ncbi:hypothetical protein D9M73_232940 [compost metagenome]
MAARQQVPLKPALADVLTEDLHDPPLCRKVSIIAGPSIQPHLVGHLKYRIQTVGRRFVRAEQAEILRRKAVLHDIAYITTQHSGRLGPNLTRARQRHAVIGVVRQIQGPQ